MPNLTYLNISRNALKGTLPLSYANLSSMQFLDLSGNNLTGELAHGDKSDLLHHGVRMLWIYFCPCLSCRRKAHHTSDHAGTLPQSWASMRDLSQFDISENLLTGTLPESWSTMTGLLDFTADHNNLHGALKRCQMRLCLLSHQSHAKESLISSASPGC